MLHQPLSTSQQEKYDHRFDPEPEKGITTEPAADARHGRGIPAQNVEAERSDGRNSATGQMQATGFEPVVQPEAESRAQGAEGNYSGWEAQGTTVSSDTRTDWVLSTPEPAVQKTDFAKAVEQPAPEEVDIQVKTVDVGAYNTINLQAEIAAGLQEVLAEDKAQTDAITRSIIAPLLDSDTESLDLPEIDEV